MYQYLPACVILPHKIPQIMELVLRDGNEANLPIMFYLFCQLVRPKPPSCGLYCGPYIPATKKIEKVPTFPAYTGEMLSFFPTKIDLRKRSL